MPLIPRQFTCRTSKLWWALLSVATLAMAGCTSSPLRNAARKQSGESIHNEEGTVASADWPGDLDHSKSQGKPRYRKIRPGESLSDIAALYGMTVPQLLSSNHGIDPADGIKPGQLIYVPRQ